VTSGSARSQLRTATDKVRIFVSFDREHDEDLLDQLVEQASAPTSSFEISGLSSARAPTDQWDEALRRAIRAADQVVVICGERTDGSYRVAAELRIAQEEQRPYLLLWGRREPMCTRPSTARSADPMYSWTPQILHNQILYLRRLAESKEHVVPRGSLAPGYRGPR